MVSYCEVCKKPAPVLLNRKFPHPWRVVSDGEGAQAVAFLICSDGCEKTALTKLGRHSKLPGG
jgi:hypothetical protein